MTTAPPAPSAAGGVDEDAAHRFGRRGEEVSAAVPVLGLFDINQPEVRLVDQGGGLQGLAGVLQGQPLGGQPAQLVVDERQELLRGVRVALLDGVQDARDVTHELLPVSLHWRSVAL